VDALIGMLAGVGEAPEAPPRVCFAAGQPSGALPDGTIRLDPALSDADNAARLAHLASHASDGLAAALDDCGQLDRAVQIEEAAWERESRIREALGGTPGSAGLDAVVEGYRTRCEAGMPRKSAAPGR
jgi:hypothetical protein